MITEFQVGDRVIVQHFAAVPYMATITDKGAQGFHVLRDDGTKHYAFDNEMTLLTFQTARALQPEKAAKSGVKYDANKISLALLSPTAINKIGQVMDFGASKYADHNWRKGMAWSRLLSACLRHVFAYINGEDKDPETGLSHLAHAACCLMFLLEYEETHPELDNRYKPKGAS